MKKRISLILLALAILITAIIVAPVSADYTSGDWQYTLSNNAATITKYNGTDASVTIPGQIDGYSVTQIGNNAFQNCTLLTVLTIPDSVETIGQDAFISCSALSVLNVGLGVKTIKGGAFRNCTSLARVNIKDIAAWCGIESGYYLFSGSMYYGTPFSSNGAALYLNGRRVTNLVIPNGVTEIKPRVFYKCSSITSITLPSTLNSIGTAALCGITNLKTVTIPDSVQSIGSEAFSSCASLENITIPDSVLSIGANAFTGCSALKSISIPDSVLSIGASAFSNCTAMNTVYLTYSVISIGQSAFSSCNSLSTVYYDGTEDDWSCISIASGNDKLKNAERIYTAHEHEYTAVVTDPTCTMGGYTTYTCSICGDSYIGDETAALGHNFVNGVCTVCGASGEAFVLYGDANGDGEITSKDITLLRRYLASYDETTGSSTIVLGPQN